MDSYKIRTGALVVVMAVVGLAAPAYGDGYTTWVNSKITTGKGVRLKLTQFEKKFDGVGYEYISDCSSTEWGMPSEVSDDTTASFCYASIHPPAGLPQIDTGLFFHYDILVSDGSGNWTDSGFWLDGAVKVAMVGDNKIDGNIRVSGSTNRAPEAPFVCETSWDSTQENAPEPHWRITAKDVTVIDASNSANVGRAAQLIGDNCESFDTPRCRWSRTKNSSAFLADRNDWQSLTNWADSCPPATKEFVLSSTRNVQISWSDTVGGKISAKMGGKAFGLTIEGSIEVSYAHSITQADTYGEGYTYSIPLGYRSALYLQHGMLEVSGDFAIITDKDRFLVKNAVFRFPIERDVQVEHRGQPVPRGVVVHTDVRCSAAPPLRGAPPPPGAQEGQARLKSGR